MGLFKSIKQRIRGGLERTREAFSTGVRSLLLGRNVDDALLDELERMLIEGDVGVRTADRLVQGVRADFKAGKISKGEDVLAYLKSEIKSILGADQRTIQFADAGPTVVLVAGVNGAGKTTSIAKIAKTFTDSGKSVLLGACDTYRAGAVRQLEIWAERLGIQIVKGQQGGDPASVAFDACDAAIARGVDVVLLDTAGRLQTQEPLMRQLTKIRDVAAKRIPGGPHEVLLVLDATTGQNAVQQAKTFGNAIGITGIFLSKLDGSAKGGVVLAIHDACSIPVKLVGVGETPADVEPFDPDAFVEAMFEEDAAKV